MNNLTIELLNENLSNQFSASLAKAILFPATLTFSGELGMGKTTLIRAFLQAYGVKGVIKSPTFSIVESYQVNELVIHHFDLYRIYDEEELEYIGFRDYFNKQAVCCIEWPERVQSTLLNSDVHFNLTLKGSGRLLTVNALSAIGETILSCLADKQ